MKVIYIAGPLGDSVGLHEREKLANVYRACGVGLALIRKGWSPIVPHLTFFMALHPDGADVLWEQWLKCDFELIRRCDALFYIGPSLGADRERRLAEELGLAVYTDLDEVPDEGGE